MKNILVYKKPDFSYVDVQVWFLYGAKDEPYGKSGIAHLLEHVKIAQMSFSGSLFARSTLHGGTGSEIMHFQFASPKDYLSVNLQEFFDELVSKSFNSCVLQEQKRKVINEVLYRRNIQVYRLIDMAMEAVFGDSFANNPGGDIDTIKCASERELAECVEKAFINGNYLLSVSGDICQNDVEYILEKYGKEISDVDIEKKILKMNGLPFITSEAEKAGLVAYAAPGKLCVYHILKIIKFYIDYQCMSDMLGRFMLIPLFSVSLFVLYMPGKDAVQNMKKLQLRFRHIPVQEEMEKVAMLYLQTREYRMQSNPNRDLLEGMLYQLSYKSVKEMARQAVKVFTDIFFAAPVYEMYVE